MPDKSVTGIIKEVESGLAVAAFYFEDTLGLPLEIFKMEMEEKCSTNDQKILWYFNFRNLHPELFKS